MCDNEVENLFPVNMSGMISWYNHSNLMYCDSSGASSSQPNWVSNVNSNLFSMVVLSSWATISGTCPQRYLNVSYQTELDFGAILGIGSFTFCTVTKITDIAHAETLFYSSLNQNTWWHGAANGNKYGGALYGNTIISNAPAKLPNLPWLVLCTASSSSFSLAYVDDFVWSGTTPSTIPGQSIPNWKGSYPGSIQINTMAETDAANPGSCNVLEIMSWGRVLSYIEISNAMAYLHVVAQQGGFWAPVTAIMSPCSPDGCDTFFPLLNSMSSMIAWYQHQNVSVLPWASQATWISSIGSFSMTVMAGFSYVTSACPGYLIANTTTRADFGAILGLALSRSAP